MLEFGSVLKFFRKFVKSSRIKDALEMLKVSFGLENDLWIIR
ncbi:hypothetical protein [Thermosipho ferrireducens]|nr:hypothetical protein [Thermosipho ferrireducens]